MEKEFDLHKKFSIDMSENITSKWYRAGETIVQEGEEMHHLYYITKGRAKCCITQENGKVSLIDLMIAPCFLGDLELIGAQKQGSGVIAITNCLCQIIHLDNCREAILNDVIFLRFLCQVLGQKALRNALYISMIQTYPFRNRLITFLLQTQNNGIYTGPLTEAADYLGVSYRHLLYVLAQLVEEGLLKKGNGVYQLCDIASLEKEKIAGDGIDTIFSIEGCQVN